MLFQMSPNVFNRIKLRCIAGEKFNFKLSLCFFNEIPDHSTMMAAQPIPDHEKIARDMAHQMSQKFNYLGTSYCSGKKTEVKSPPGNACNSRNCLPIEVKLKYRSLPTRRPGTTTMRPFAQTAFVYEYNGLPLYLGFFLSSGQRFFFHWRMASSFRSRALPVGRWQLHPSCFKIFQTCPGWYCTPHSRSIRSATRHAVQRPVSYPKASGPRFSASRMFFSSFSDKRGFRPARLAFFRPAIPDSSNCLAQRLTDCRWAPTRRATSASWMPFPNSLAAFMRRFSSASKFRFTPAGFPIQRSILQNYKYVTILCGTQ